MRPLYIFDLDGTLALIEHRRHLVEGPSKDWRAFFAACVDDLPNEPVIRTLHGLRAAGAEIWIWSGRSDEVREQTVAWLIEHRCLTGLAAAATKLPGWPFHAESFRMRKAGDFTPDEKLKFGWLADMEPPERNRLTAVFDDRDKVVRMWREAGVPCFQVAPGEF